MLALGIHVQKIARLAIGTPNHTVVIEKHDRIGKSADQRRQGFLSEVPFTKVGAGGGNSIGLFPGPDHSITVKRISIRTVCFAYDKFLTNEKERPKLA